MITPSNDGSGATNGLGTTHGHKHVGRSGFLIYELVNRSIA